LTNPSTKNEASLFALRVSLSLLASFNNLIIALGLFLISGFLNLLTYSSAKIEAKTWSNFNPETSYDPASAKILTVSTYLLFFSVEFVV
jgi:hypothetical protein